MVQDINPGSSSSRPFDLTEMDSGLFFNADNGTHGRELWAATTLDTYTLSVSKSGTGSGTVSSDPAGIDCGTTCSADYDYNTVVTLSASADPGSTFTGWSGGGCSGTGDCVVTMDGARSVTAEFTLEEYYPLYLPIIMKNY
jgi:hypothetical protein